MGESEHTVVKATARIDWRKLLWPLLLIMVLPTISAFLLDKWLGSLPFITIVAILLCFPTATFWVIREAMSEMDRVIAEVTPPPAPQPEMALEAQATPEDELAPAPATGTETSPTP